MKNIIFIAPPAAGKGTQSKLVSEEYNIPHISTGDLLREEIAKGTSLGKSIKEDMEKGNLVSDEVITTLLKNRITSDDCKNGYILDGYPRNITQAKIYNELLEELGYDKGVVIFFDIDKERALKRTLSRIICSNCGSSYNLLVEELKPKKENICDRCGTELNTRKDDTEEVFIHRFDTYINSTKDLIDYYNELGLLHKIEVLDKPASVIFEEVKKVLND
jgi:adenylate kinase